LPEGLLKTIYKKVLIIKSKIEQNPTHNDLFREFYPKDAYIYGKECDPTDIVLSIKKLYANSCQDS
jgi:hypothetical protein